MKEWIFSKSEWLTKSFSIYAVTILIIGAIGRVCGEDAKVYSSLYRLGSAGLSLETLVQLLISSGVYAGLSTFFFSENHLKGVSVRWKIAITMLTTLLVTIGFIVCFKWLPLEGEGVLLSWGGFIVSFLVCFFVAVALSTVKVKVETKKYDKLLKNYKEKRKEKEDE